MVSAERSGYYRFVLVARLIFYIKNLQRFFTNFITAVYGYKIAEGIM
jgi:hypothetical protein